jgi:hydroxyacylglutathione hydrolase
MKIHQLILGNYETNSYCLTVTDDAKDCLIIDTGLDSKPLIDFLKKNSLNPVAVIFTHGHADHISGVCDLRENWPEIKVVIHKNDADMLHDAEKNLSAMAGIDLTADPAEVIIDNESDIEFVGIKFKVFHTPGHTQGGICLYNVEAKVVFVGDTLFASSIGRTDLPGGDYSQLVSGIKAKLLKLDGSTHVLPGHGPATTIETEKNTNQYLTN